MKGREEGSGGGGREREGEWWRVVDELHAMILHVSLFLHPVERRRRDRINELIKTLAQIVPGCQKKDATTGNIVGVGVCVWVCECMHIHTALLDGYFCFRAQPAAAH